MKDHIESSHLAKFNAFSVNRYQVTDLETWFKINTTSLILSRHPATPSKLLNLFSDFCDALKNGQTYVIFISASFKW